MPGWTGSHVRCGISKVSRYEPDVNPSYHDLAEQYSVVLLVVTRWDLVRLRHQRFFGLNEAQPHTARTADRPSQHPFKKMHARVCAFAARDQSALGARYDSLSKALQLCCAHRMIEREFWMHVPFAM